MKKLKKQPFDLFKIYKKGTNRELEPEELAEYLIPIRKRSCPVCDDGILERTPLDVHYKMVDEKSFVIINTTIEGRLEAIEKEDMNYIWGCNHEKCVFADIETVKNGKNTKSEIIATAE